MITLFSLPKAYTNDIAIIQRNALASWVLLNPHPDILILGDEEGAEEAAREFGVRYEPEIERNEWGTPLVSSLFERGQSLATHDVMVYISADIILLSDFMPAVANVLCQFSGSPNFLGIGERWDIDITEPLDFSQGWEERLRADVEERGVRHGPTGVDYHLFRRGMYKTVPPFAIGRRAYDNWLVTEALRQGIPVINMTKRVLAVHQNHGYRHESRDELETNQTLMEKAPAMHISHATHTLSGVSDDTKAS